jgi:hypothetical protein
LGDTYQLTVSTNVCILGFVQVLPESSIGTFAAIGSASAGFAVWVKMKQHKKTVNVQKL